MEPDPSIGRVPQLGDYAAVLRARKWLVISITLLALVGAGTYLAVRTPVYSSSSELQIFATDQGLGTSVDLETEARIAGSLSVAALALPKMGSTFASAEELLKHVTVSLPTDAAILTITFTHTNRGVAEQGARYVADSYLEFKANQSSQELATKLANLDSQAAALRVKDAAQIAIIADPNSSVSDKLAARIERAGIRTNLADIASQKFALENDQPPAGKPLGPPTTASLASPGVPLVAIGAGVLGLFLGSILAFIVEGLTGRVREAEEVEQELGSAVLGMVPVMHLKRSRGRLPVVSRDAPSDPAAEAYRLLRSGFLYSAGSDERVVMVTSPGVGDGKSTTAANLAVSLAQAGHRTVLVGGDLRRSDLHTLFGVPNDTGLVHVLEGRSSPTPLPTDVENLRIVPSGPPTEISAHLFETEAFPEALAILRAQAEYVVVDAPPLAISDPLLMVPSVDYVLFVVDAGKATRRALRRTRELLQRIGLPRMGVVLNRSKSPWGPSGTRAYYYYKKGKAAGVPTAQESAPELAAPVVAAEPKPAESQPTVESKPTVAKPVESQPTVESTPEESQPTVESKPAEKPAESKSVETKPVETKPVETKPAAAAQSQPKPGITQDAKSRPAAANKSQPPAATVAAPGAAEAKTTPASVPAAPVPASTAPPANQAPTEPAGEPAAARPAQPVTSPVEAVAVTPAGTEAAPAAPPIPVDSSPSVPPVPEAGTPAPPVPVPTTPSAPKAPPVPAPAAEQTAEPVAEVMPEPVVEPSSRNGGRASKRSGSRKRRSGSRGRSRPSGG